MPRGLLWLGFSLLGALLIQAQEDTTPDLLPAPSLDSIPLQPNFQADQFQGKWYVVGLAGNVFSKEQGEYKMYSVNLELKDDHCYNVTTIMLNQRNENCDYFINTVEPGSQPGEFNLDNMKAYPGIKSYTVRVVTTNYNEFAMVFFKAVFHNLEIFKITLIGRTKELTPERKEEFIRFSKSLGLTDDHILFPVPIDKCIDG